MRKIAVVLFALAVTCLSGEPPTGKQNQCVAIGSIGDHGYDAKVPWEKFEVYEDWERGYFIYKQVNYEDNGSEAGDVVSISITAVPIRTDWPPKQPAEEGK